MQDFNRIEAEGAGHLAEPLGKLTRLTSLNLVRACGDMTEWWAAKWSGKGLSEDGRDLTRFGCSERGVVVERWGSMEGSALICLCAVGRDGGIADDVLLQCERGCGRGWARRGRMGGRCGQEAVLNIFMVRVVCGCGWCGLLRKA